MELSTILHIEPDQLNDFEADLFITTLSCESRCTTVARKLEGTKISRKIVLVKDDECKLFSCPDNKLYFEDHGFEPIMVESKIPDMGALFTGYEGKLIKVILDCTCMSTRWYYEFFNWFGENQAGHDRAILRMAYAMSDLEDQEQVLKVKSMKNFIRKEPIETQKKKSALFLGLGHEKGVSEAIYNKIKPDLLYLFYTDPPADKKSVERVFVNNHALINATPIRNLVSYPIRNGQTIYQKLIDTILPLRTEYSIILVPHGPKFFYVISLLVHLGYPDIQVNYPKFKKSVPMDRTSSGEPVFLDVLFEGEE